MGFPCGSAGKESACNEGDVGLIPGLGRSPGQTMAQAHLPSNVVLEVRVLWEHSYAHLYVVSAVAFELQ